MLSRLTTAAARRLAASSTDPRYPSSCTSLPVDTLAAAHPTAVSRPPPGSKGTCARSAGTAPQEHPAPRRCAWVPCFLWLHCAGRARPPALPTLPRHRNRRRRSAARPAAGRRAIVTIRRPSGRAAAPSPRADFRRRPAPVTMRRGAADGARQPASRRSLPVAPSRPPHCRRRPTVAPPRLTRSNRPRALLPALSPPSLLKRQGSEVCLQTGPRGRAGSVVHFKLVQPTRSLRHPVPQSTCRGFLSVFPHQQHAPVHTGLPPCARIRTRSGAIRWVCAPGTPPAAPSAGASGRQRIGVAGL